MSEANGATLDFRVSLRGIYDKPVIEALRHGQVVHTDAFDPFDARQRLAFYSLANGKPLAPDEADRYSQLLLERANQAAEVPATAASPIPVASLIKNNPRLREPIVDGLQRRGETMNVIAAPKVGKSWLTYSLALAIAIGSLWLGRFRCQRGRVLVVDLELHPETLASRIPRVADALGIEADEYQDNLDVLPLRGKNADLHRIARDLEGIGPGVYSMVILDAWYRVLPAGVSENDNAQVGSLYSIVDGITATLDSAWVNVHHASKGSQANKDATDVGAGAGSQSRAADTHLVLRPHEVDSCVVLEAAVRSWAPVEPLVLKWDFPVWRPVDGIDPTQLKGRGTKQEERQREKDQAGMVAIVESLRDGPTTERALRGKADITKDRLRRLLDNLEREGSVGWQSIEVRGNPCREYHLKE